jgi:hypothetical protein
MLLSIIKLNKLNIPIIVQEVALECDLCKKKWIIKDIRTFLKQEKQGIHKCFNCSRSKWQKGRRHSEETIKKMSDKKKGKKNILSEEARKRASDRTRKYNFLTKGKTLEERLGKEKSDILRKKRSENVKGDKNPMFGKPAPIGSGASKQGWYKNIYFRSILELSFIINYLEKNNIEYINCDQNIDFRIKYLIDEKERNYFPDFFLVKEKILIEIKPLYWKENCNIVKLKEKFAILWCYEKKYKYKLYTEMDFDRLNKHELSNLENSGMLKFRRVKKSL